MPFYKILDNAIVVDDASFAGATSATMNTIIGQAVTTGLQVDFRPGNYDFGNLVINGPVRFRGSPGNTVFRMTAGSEYLLYLGAFTRACFSGITFDGMNNAFAPSPGLPVQALVNAQKASSTIASSIVFEQCRFIDSTRSGLSLNEVDATIDDCSFTNCAGRGIGAVSTSRLVVRDSHFEALDQAVHCSPGAASGVTIESNAIFDCRRNGIALEPIGANAKVGKNIRISGNQIAKKNAMWAVSQVDSGNTGWEGNGIIVLLAENVIVEGNEINDCRFSGIRLNVCSQASVADNVVRGSGETAIYVEAIHSDTNGQPINVGEFGATLSGNVVYGGGAGISAVNFNNGGTFATISGNILRDVSEKAIAYGSGQQYWTTGAGIYVEGDCAVTGNSIRNCRLGIALGSNSDTRDLAATGNVIRQSTAAIAVSDAARAGTISKQVLLAGNLVAGYSAAIQAFIYDGITGKANLTGADFSPANRGSAVVGQVHMIGNVKRAAP